MNVTEVAAFCGVTRGTVYNWLRKGLIKPVGNKGRALEFNEDDIIEFWKDPPRRGRPKTVKE